MTNNLAYDIVSRGQELANNLNSMGIDDADVEDGLKTLVEKVLDISGVSNSLTIEVPLNLIYSDDFNITGTLLDSNDSSIRNASVKLKVGSTVVDTQTTNNNGVVSFTQSPVTMDTHSFQLVFDGDGTHRGCESSVISRVIGKETSVLTVTTPANNSSYYADGSISVTGTLLSDDAEVIAGKSVVVSENGTTLTTLTTQNDGSFSGTINGLSVGSHTLDFNFATDDYYAASSVSRSVIVNSPSLSIALTEGNEVLSYADEQRNPGSQYATLTATYVGATVNNQPIEFYKDGVLWDTVNTDSSGKASKTYVSAGVGDVEISVKKGISLIQTYEIEDCIFYDKNERSATTSSSMVRANIYNNMSLNLPSHFEWSMDFKVSSTSGSEDRIFLTASGFSGEQPPNAIWIQYGGSSLTGGVRDNGNTIYASNGITGSSNTYATFTVEVNGTDISFKVNGNDVGNRTSSWITNKLNWWFCYSFWKRPSITGTWKNMKIKAL